jgi:osmotically-inducible protein OsmY
MNDLDVTAALNAFVRNAMADGVAVEFAGGIASLSGHVSSPTSRRAIEDLTLAHEGVLSVVNKLVVRPQAVAQREQR